MCEEQASPLNGTGSTAGSSLRVRGTADNSGLTTLEWRVIPACAGNGEARWYARCVLPCHPCVCGERGKELTEGAIEFGSSLRVRGTGLCGGLGPCRARVIPACAGNSPGVRSCWSVQAGHPCVCGERCMPSQTSKTEYGPSLRVQRTGVIAACAGSGPKRLRRAQQPPACRR